MPGRAVPWVLKSVICRETGKCDAEVWESDAVLYCFERLSMDWACDQQLAQYLLWQSASVLTAPCHMEIVS